MTTDPRMEAAAEAIYVENVGVDDSGPFEFFHERKKNYYRAKALAVLAASDAVDPLRQPWTTTEWGVQGTEAQGIEAAPSEPDARAAVAYLTTVGEVASLVARQITAWEPAS